GGAWLTELRRQRGRIRPLSCLVVAMQPQNRTADQKLARIALKQHGNVTFKQAQAAEIEWGAIRVRLDRGSLLPVFRGVYRVGHAAPSTESYYMAAVLACGRDAKLSGRAAAHLLGLTRAKAPPPEVATRTERRIKGIKTKRER